MATFFVAGVGSRTLMRNFIKIKPEALTKRYISTSNKSKDTSTITEPLINKPKVTEASENPKKKNWVTFGFSQIDEATDRFQMHASMFLMVSVCLVGGAFIFAYMPDLRAVDWVHREGYLELHRRATLGLPLIDKNLVDPSKINLPTDEELDDTDIII